MDEFGPQLRLISGSSHFALAHSIARELGVGLLPVALGRFPDGELSVELHENVRGCDTFVVQTVALDPNTYLMELLILIDALKRASAKSITAVVPYFGYCRQDHKGTPGESIAAKLVANLLACAGASRIVTMDLHSGQVQGFFDIPVDNLMCMPLLASAFRQHVASRPCVVVAPDLGSIKRARAYASFLGVDFAVVDKHRLSATHVEVLTVIGDVKEKDILLADDMCSTGGTLVSAANACQEKGARRIYAAVAHGVLVGDAVEQIEQSPIEALWITDTIPATERLHDATKLKVVSVAPLFAEVIRCIVNQKSLLAHKGEL